MKQIKKKKKNNFVYLFLAVTVLHIIARFYELTTIAGISKTLLVPTLLFLLLYSTDRKPKISLLLGALVFSWLGDVLLLGSDDSAEFFIAGLISFLVAHLFYIKIVLRLLKGIQYKFSTIFISAFVIIGYVIFILSILIPNIEGLLLPAIVAYALILGLMVFLSILLLGHHAVNPRNMVTIGAILFVLSDSSLAISRFGDISLPSNWSAVIIMSTYCAAQLCLTLGITSTAKFTD